MWKRVFGGQHPAQGPHSKALSLFAMVSLIAVHWVIQISVRSDPFRFGAVRAAFVATFKEISDETRDCSTFGDLDHGSRPDGQHGHGASR
jgi:hypothetical protein